MKRYVSAIAATAVASFLTVCADKACNQGKMIEAINDDIREDGRNPNEYQQSAMQPEGKAVYIGMALKMSPLYHRHYLLDPRTCKILDVKIDQ